MLSQLDKKTDNNHIAPKEGQRGLLSSDFSSVRCPFLGDIEPEFLDFLGEKKDSMTPEEIKELYHLQAELADKLFTLWIQTRNNYESTRTN